MAVIKWDPFRDVLLLVRSGKKERNGPFLFDFPDEVESGFFIRRHPVPETGADRRAAGRNQP